MSESDRKNPWEDAPPEILRLNTFLNGFYEETDRGAVLMAASILDEVWLSLIQAFLVDTPKSKKLLDDFNAPLGTFSSRILAAYAMGLIEEREFNEVEAIRKIRNLLGHSWGRMDFDSPKLKGQIDKLPFENEKPRARLNGTVANLLGDWLWRERLVKKERRQFKKWEHKAGFGRSLPDLGDAEEE
jgi:mannitol operon repressor